MWIGKLNENIMVIHWLCVNRVYGNWKILSNAIGNQKERNLKKENKRARVVWHCGDIWWIIKSIKKNRKTEKETCDYYYHRSGCRYHTSHILHNNFTLSSWSFTLYVYYFWIRCVETTTFAFQFRTYYELPSNTTYRRKSIKLKYTSWQTCLNNWLE